MHRFPFVVLSCVLSCVLGNPARAQTRTSSKEPTFPEAVEAARKAADAGEFGSAIASLQAAIRDLQKKQRAAILAALPKPAGWAIEDEPEQQGIQGIELGTALMGLSLQRHYTKGDQRLDVEVLANSPMLQTLAIVLANPELVKSDGGEPIEYGPHKAMLKKNGDDGAELQILMHSKHMVKVTSQGVGGDDVLKVFDQAAVDRLEKPLGK